MWFFNIIKWSRSTVHLSVRCPSYPGAYHTFDKYKSIHWQMHIDTLRDFSHWHIDCLLVHIRRSVTDACTTRSTTHGACAHVPTRVQWAWCACVYKRINIVKLTLTFYYSFRPILKVIDFSKLNKVTLTFYYNYK